ncbi:MAG TPA: hypothetical protein VLB83_04235, partial [Candidatus Paceibacterota bacterium]|nr:hypothetical protein [Candidatus Paceibacterota bacterium]
MNVAGFVGIIAMVIIVCAAIAGILSIGPTVPGLSRRRAVFWAVFGLLFGAVLIALSTRAEAGGSTITDADVLTARVRMAQDALRNDAAISIADLDTHTVREKLTKCVRVKGKKKPVCTASFRNVVKQRLTRRITLSALDEATGEIHTIALAVPHPLPESGFPYTVLTPGYHVEHLAGRGVVRLVFRVWKDGQELAVLAAKHPWVPSRYWSSKDLELVFNRAEAIVYTQPVPHFLDRQETFELVKEGFVYWTNEARNALAELRAARALSLTYPDRPLADTISPELLIALGAIEQMDDRQFLDDPDRTADTVALHYALNREEAFSRSVSSANARGAYQFTEKNGNGTYTLVVRTY